MPTSRRERWSLARWFLIAMAHDHLGSEDIQFTQQHDRLRTLGAGKVPPSNNRLLAALPQAELRALESKLEYIRLPLGRSLHEQGEPVRYVFFPTSGIVSLHYVNESGASAELTVIAARA